MTPLKVTDAGHTEEILIPVDLAQSVGVFKDMIGSQAIAGNEPVNATH